MCVCVCVLRIILWPQASKGNVNKERHLQFFWRPSTENLLLFFCVAQNRAHDILFRLTVSIFLFLNVFFLFQCDSLSKAFVSRKKVDGRRLGTKKKLGKNPVKPERPIKLSRITSDATEKIMAAEADEKGEVRR